MLIIWMEDDAQIIWPVVELLERDGREIKALRTVSDVLDAIDLVRLGSVIVMDMILPKGKAEDGLGRYPGLTLLKRLREKGVVAPAVIMSVVDRTTVEPQLAGLEVVEYLRKPVMRSELKKAVDAALEKVATQVEIS